MELSRENKWLRAFIKFERVYPNELKDGEIIYYMLASRFGNTGENVAHGPVKVRRDGKNILLTNQGGIEFPLDELKPTVTYWRQIHGGSHLQVSPPKDSRNDEVGEGVSDPGRTGEDGSHTVDERI